MSSLWMSKIGRAVGLFFLAGALGQLVSAAPPLPNVVIIYADDMGYGDLGVQNPDSLNMMPVLRDQAESPRDSLVYNNKVWDIRKGDWVLLENPKDSKKADYLKANRFPKIQEGSDVLYNLSEDLGQRVDLLKKYPEKAEQLHEILHQARSKRN